MITYYHKINKKSIQQALTVQFMQKYCELVFVVALYGEMGQYIVKPFWQPPGTFS